MLLLPFRYPITQSPRGLARLPIELLIKIVFALDGYSINNLVDAYPEISQHFLLMTANSTVFSSSYLRLHRSEDSIDLRHYIKLYEHDPNTGYWKDIPTLRYFDTLCFVHIKDFSTVPGYYRNTLREFPYSTFEGGFCGGHGPVFKAKEYLTAFRDGSNLAVEHNTSLVLKDIRDELNGFSSSILKHLVLVFSSSAGETVSPQLHNVILSNLETLTIVYYDQVPDLRGVCLGDDTRGSRTLRLVHAPSMRCDLKSPLPEGETLLNSETRYALGDLSALSEAPQTEDGTPILPLPHYCAKIDIIGGPVCLGKLLCSARAQSEPSRSSIHTNNICSLYWRQTTISRTPQENISLAQVFDRPKQSDKFYKTDVTYECTFLNPVPFKSDIIPGFKQESNYGHFKLPIQPLGVALIYHSKQLAPGASMRSFTDSINEYLDGFLENGTAQNYIVCLLWQPSREEMESTPFPMFRPTSHLYNYFTSRNMMERSFLFLIGCPMVHDTPHSAAFHQTTKEGYQNRRQKNLSQRIRFPEGVEWFPERT